MMKKLLIKEIEWCNECEHLQSSPWNILYCHNPDVEERKAIGPGMKDTRDKCSIPSWCPYPTVIEENK